MQRESTLECALNVFRIQISIRRGDDCIKIAYVLINTELGFMERVLEALRKIDAVEEVYMVYGVYDIVAKVRADTVDNIKDIVTQHVRQLEKIRSTITMIVTEEAK